jgi:hypothetical protein
VDDKHQQQLQSDVSAENVEGSNNNQAAAAALPPRPPAAVAAPAPPVVEHVMPSDHVFDAVQFVGCNTATLPHYKTGAEPK